MKKYSRIQNLDFRLDQARILTVGGEEKPLQEGLFRLRNHFAGVLDRTFGEKEASIMKAMLLGEKNGLDQETKELYQENSMIHILSISGVYTLSLAYIISCKSPIFSLFSAFYIPINTLFFILIFTNNTDLSYGVK